MQLKNDTIAGLPRIKMPVIVEGRYDKSAILGMFSGVVITTDGFSVFNSKEKQALIRKISENGIIVLTDSDGGGKQIRGFLSSILPREKIYHLYIPRVEGKESRKKKAGKEGILGVEGIGKDVIRSLLMPFTDGSVLKTGDITSFDMYELGLSGGDSSSEMRDKVALYYSLPVGMSAKALLSALNIITSRDELAELINNK